MLGRRCSLVVANTKLTSAHSTAGQVPAPAPVPRGRIQARLYGRSYRAGVHGQQRATSRGRKLFLGVWLLAGVKSRHCNTDFISAKGIPLQEMGRKGSSIPPVFRHSGTTGPCDQSRDYLKGWLLTCQQLQSPGIAQVYLSQHNINDLTWKEILCKKTNPVKTSARENCILQYRSSQHSHLL